MPELSSSNLAACEYDEATQQLTIVFRDGPEYTYEGVPVAVYEGLLSAPSAGRYFHQMIRTQYPFVQGA